MSNFSYYTIANPSHAKLTVKNSRFLAYAFPVSDEEHALKEIQQLRELEPKASHHCYALRIGIQGELFRANDDGEPSGTAGRPILGQIDSQQLTNILVVVVRYYGGVNLGVSGLIKAYKKSAALALKEANRIHKEVTTQITVNIDYANVNEFQEWVNQLPVTIVNESYTNTMGQYILQFPVRLADQIKTELKQFSY